MNAKTFIEANDKYFLGYQNSDQYLLAQKVHHEAIEHTKRLEKSRLTEKAMSQEPENIKRYRNENDSRITSAAPRKFLTKSTRIFKTSGLSVNLESLSDPLSENLSLNPFYYLNNRTDLMSFVLNCFYPESIDDPNGAWLNFPYNPDNPNIPPANSVEDGGLPSNKRIAIESKIIPFSLIVETKTPDVFSFYGGLFPVKDRGGRVQYRDYFWVIDKEYWYRYIPVRWDEKELVYEPQEWYFHDTGEDSQQELPVVNLVGLIAKSEKGSPYHESFLAPYFSYANLAKIMLSDAFGTWIQNNYPIIIMKEMPCPVENCNGGKIREKDKGRKDWATCGHCKGEGTTKNPGPYGVFIRPPSGGHDEKPEPVYERINPPEGLLKTVFELPMDVILKKGEQAIGLDVMEKIAESGTAKGLRLEDLKDVLHTIAHKIADAVQLYLWHRECILQVDRQKRIRPKVNRPVDLQLKTIADLREEASQATGVNKYFAQMRLIEMEYKGNDRLIKMFSLLYEWEPLTLYEGKEGDDHVFRLLNNDVIDEKRIIKRENAQMIFKNISQLPDFLDLEKKDVFALANAEVEKYKIDAPKTNINEVE